MRSVLAHAVLALVGLALAYQTWTRPQIEENKPSDEVVLLDCEPERIESVVAEFSTHEVKLVPARAQGAVAHWITVARKNREPSAVTPEAPPPEPAKKPARPVNPDAPVTFAANRSLGELLPLLAPLRALRDLGTIADKERADFGLDKPDAQLRVSCGGKSRVLDIGARTFGAGDRYARDTQTGRAYLLPARILQDLQAAQQRLMQVELHDFSLADVDAIVLKSGGQERRLLHRDRAQRERAQWVDAAAPDRRNEAFGNWLERVAKLRAKAYLASGQQPGDDLQIDKSAPKTVLQMQLELEGKPKGSLELARVDTADGNFYYARTEATRVWVAMFDSLAKQVEDDVAMVVAGEDAPLSKPVESAPAAAPAVQHP